MYYPTTRVLTILEMLQGRPGLSAAAIAEQLEVNRRTVRRYITMLQEMGIPIETTRGPYGGYRLRPGFKLPPLMLNNEEALAITLSLIAAQHQGLSVEGTATAGALAKIERVLPDQLREQVQAVRAGVTFTLASNVYPAQSAILMQLGLAIQRSEQVQLWYQSGTSTSERRVNPYGVVFHWGRWYLAAWCHLRQAVRVFRLDRVQAIEVVCEKFERPDGFDSLTFVTQSLAMLPWGWEVEVLLETTLECAKQRLPPGWGILTQVEEGVVLRGQYDHLDWIAAQLLLLNCSLSIRKPVELLDTLRSLAKRAYTLANMCGKLESRGRAVDWDVKL